MTETKKPQRQSLIYRDKSPIHVTRSMLDVMKVMLKENGVVVWSYQGMKRLIPRAVIQNLVTVYEDYANRPSIAGIHRIPKHVMEITWEQTELLKGE